MAATKNVNKDWTGEQKKKVQQWLNRYGFTDINGNKLDEDGMIGPKTNEALEKMNRYQKDLKSPSAETKQLQKQLNDWGYNDANGNSLNEDGIYGPKTDAANNEFENGFLDGLLNGKIKQKTVQKNEVSKMPELAGVDLKNYIIPKSEPEKTSVADAYNPASYIMDPVIGRLPVANNSVIENIKKLIEQQRKNSMKKKSPIAGLKNELENKEFKTLNNKQPEEYTLNFNDNSTEELSSSNLNSFNIKAKEKIDGTIKQIGMHYDDNDTDEKKDDFFYSTPDNFRELFGYGDKLDEDAKRIRFDLNTDKAIFLYKGKEYRFQVWDGNYLLDSLVTGAESGLYQKNIGTTPWDYAKKELGIDYNVTSKENQVEMVVELWDHTNEKRPILTVDSADYCQDYNNGKTYWQFGSKLNAGVDKENLYIKGTLRSEDKGLLEAMAGSKSEKGDILFDKVTGLDNSGNYTLTYTFDPQKKHLKSRLSLEEEFQAMVLLEV